MKVSLLFFSFLTFSVNAQLVEKIKSELSNVQTLPVAYEYLRSNSNLNGQILILKSGTDTTALDQELIATSKGDLIDFDSDDKKTHFFFKTLATNYVNSFRAQYIYLDNWEFTVAQIDSIRSIILKRLNDGETFDKLAMEYSMDANAKKGGDKGWFEEGRMVAEIETGIRNRKINEVYTVDVPSYKWYYVIKNTHIPRVDKKITVLQIEINN